MVVIQSTNGQYCGRYQLTITYLNGDLSPAKPRKKVANQYVVNRCGSWSELKFGWQMAGIKLHERVLE